MSADDRTRAISFVGAINEALHLEMQRDERVFIIGEDIGRRGGDFGATEGVLNGLTE